MESVTSLRRFLNLSTHLVNEVSEENIMGKIKKYKVLADEETKGP